MKNEFVKTGRGRIVKESEKAICIKFEAVSSSGAEFDVNMWFPKSQIVEQDSAILIKEWIFAKNVNEKANQFSDRVDIWAQDENGKAIRY